MAATFYWCEDNGAALGGSPAYGTNRTVNVSQVNWKNTDDVATAYTSSPISAGNNSYTKYQFGLFSGTFNQIANVKYAHTTGALGAGLTLKTVMSSGYATPGTATNAALTQDMTSTQDVTTGYAVLLHQRGPHYAEFTTLSATGYTAYMPTQLQTTVAASAGDTALVTISLRFDEN
jgi:hypothetical protein